MINFQQYKVTAAYSNLEFWSDFNKAGLFFGCPDRVNGAGSISKDKELVQQKTGQERLALLCWTFMAAELSLEDQPNSFQHQEKRGVPGQGQEGWRSLCPARKLICIQNNWTLYFFLSSDLTQLFILFWSLGLQLLAESLPASRARVQQCRGAGAASSHQPARLWQSCKARGPAALPWPSYTALMPISSAWSFPQCLITVWFFRVRARH